MVWYDLVNHTMKSCLLTKLADDGLRYSDDGSTVIWMIVGGDEGKVVAGLLISVLNSG